MLERDDYYRAADIIAESACALPDVYSLLLFGSTAKGTHRPPMSDIDMALVMDADVVTSPFSIYRIGEAFTAASLYIKERAPRFSRAGVELAVYDAKTMRDGRFFTFDAGFRNHFLAYGTVLFGTDFRSEMPARNMFHSREANMAHNLRAIRKYFLELDYTLRYDFDETARRFGSSLGKLSDVRHSYTDYTGDAVPEELGLGYFMELAHDHGRFDALLSEAENGNAFSLITEWGEVMNAYERVVQHLVYNFPKAAEEAKRSHPAEAHQQQS